MFEKVLLPINPLHSISLQQAQRPIPSTLNHINIINSHQNILSNYENTLQQAIARFGDDSLSSRKLCLRGVKDSMLLAKSIAKESPDEKHSTPNQHQIRAYSGYISRISPHCNLQFGINLRNNELTSVKEVIKEAKHNQREVKIQNKIQRYSRQRNKWVKEVNNMYDALRSDASIMMINVPAMFHHKKTASQGEFFRNHLARDDRVCRHNLASFDKIAPSGVHSSYQERDDLIYNCNILERINQKLLALSLENIKPYKMA